MIGVIFVLCSALPSSPAQSAAEISPAHLETLSQLLAAKVAEFDHLEVMSEQDIRRVVTLEAQRQESGQCDDESCLSEVAAAMGARWILMSDAGYLGDRLVLSLAVIDAHSAEAVGRAVLEADSLSHAGELGRARVALLVARAVPPGPTRERMLVLDTRAAGSDDPPPRPEAGLPVMLFVGAGVAVAGVATLGAGGGLWAWALATEADAKAAPNQIEAAQRFGARDDQALAGNLALAAGSVALALGVGLAALSMVGP